MHATASISFHYQAGPFYFPRRTALKTFLNTLFKEEGLQLDALSYVFCTDAYLYEYNKTYLQHDTLTDIITFPLSEPGLPILGDIYISVDRVKDNARQLGQAFIIELHRVIFHGALHLCGYKDKTKKEQALMREREDAYLARYFVPRETF